MKADNKLRKLDEINRREFIMRAAKTYLGVGFGSMLGTSIASNAHALQKGANGLGSAENIIYIMLDGGMSHIDTFDPKPKNPAIQGPLETIKTKSDEIRVTQLLPKTAEIADKLCVINSMTTKQGAHEEARYVLARSYDMRGTINHPVLGSWVLRLAGPKHDEIPGFVSIGGSPERASAGFLGSTYAGAPIGRPQDGLKNSRMHNNVDDENFDRRLALAQAMNENFHGRFESSNADSYKNLYEDAVKLMRSEDLVAFDITKENEKTRKAYGDNNFGQGCLLARRLVQHGVRFVQVTMGGWDTHYDNFRSMENLCQTFDHSYAALLRDLDQQGMLDKTLVVLATEFGRTPEIVTAHADGRDHHPAAFTCVLAGGGMKASYRHGETDRNGDRITSDPVTPQQLNATIAHAIGMKYDQTIYSPSGRPFTVSDSESPVFSLFA